MFSKWNYVVQRMFEIISVNKDLANNVLDLTMDDIVTDKNDILEYLKGEYTKLIDYDLVSFMTCLMVVKERIYERIEKDKWNGLFTNEILTKIVNGIQNNITFTCDEDEDRKMFKRNLNIFYRKCAPDRLRDKDFHLSDIVEKYYENQEDLNKKLMDIYGYNLHTMNEKVTRRKMRRKMVETGLLDFPSLLS